MGLGFGDWQGGSLNGGVIQLVCSSWAEKMIILRLKSGGVGLFKYLLISNVILMMLCYYMVSRALYFSGS